MNARNLKPVTLLLQSFFLLVLAGCGSGGGGGSVTESGGPAAGDIVSVTMIATVSKVEAATILGAAAIPVIPVYDLKVYRIVYLTPDENGTLINASGALVVPQNLAASAPLLSSQHGTTTLKSDVASTPPAAGQPYTNLEALAIGSAGYVGVFPDYIGYGESGNRFHPYLHARTLASAVVDLLRGAKKYCAENAIPLSGKLFLVGYSEGGYATMAAIKEIQEKYAAEITVTAAAPMAGPYDLSTSLADTLSSGTYPAPGYIAFALWAYDRVYSLDMSARIFMPVFATSLDSLFDGTHDLQREINPVLPTDLATLFLGSFLTAFSGTGEAQLKARIAENNLHHWAPAFPVRLIHCRGDEIVSFKNSQTAFDNFIANGAGGFVELIDPVSTGSHATCAIPAVLAAKVWFDSLK